MDQTTPALADAFRLLRRDICGYLDEAEFLSTKLTEWTTEDAQSARRLVPDLVTIVRGILIDHKETADATCGRCNANWPCSTVNTIHGLVKNPDHEFVKITQRALVDSRRVKSPQTAEYQRLGWSVYVLGTTVWLTPSTPIEAFNVPSTIGERTLARPDVALPVINIPGPPDRWALLTQPHNGPPEEILTLCAGHDIGYAYRGHHNGRTSDWSIDLPPTQHAGHQPLSWITPPATPLPAARTVAEIISELTKQT